MMIIPGTPEMYLPPTLSDRVKDRVVLKTAMKVEKNVFKIPDNEKCPKTNFIVSSILRLNFRTRKQMEDTKIVLDRDEGNGAPIEDDDDDDNGEEEDDC